MNYCTVCHAYRGLPAPPRPETPEPAPAEPAPRRRGRLAAPLLVFSVAILALAGAIVFNTIRTKPVTTAAGPSEAAEQPGGDPATPSEDPSSPSPSPSALPDQCLMGTWRETVHLEDIDVDQVGLVRFSGEGVVRKFANDGTAVRDYGTGDGTQLTGTKDGTTYAWSSTGTVQVHFGTHDGLLSYQNSQPDGTQTLRANGKKRTTRALALDPAPEHYVCTSATLRLISETATVELARVG